MERYSSISNWIEKIIDSCDRTKLEQEKICDNLITNFTNQILFINNNFVLYRKYEKQLRNKLLAKFYSKIH